jgi:hypothetical protein
LRRRAGVRNLGRVKNLCAALIVIVSCAIATSPARADIEWTTTDTVAQATVGTLLLADYLQTVRIVRDPVNEGDLEHNPIMRSHRGGLGLSPELYFASVAGLHTMAVVALPQLLPRSWRRPARLVMQGAVVAVQVDSIVHNWQAGYTLTW